MGSSDCHVPEKVGACATWFPEEVKTMEEFMQALKKGGMKPAYYEDGAYLAAFWHASTEVLPFKSENVYP